MSELSIIIPTQRSDPGATLTIAFAVALTVHVFPLIAADPEAPAIELDYAVGCFPCHYEVPEEEAFESAETACMRLDDEPARLSRELAIENARIGGVGSPVIEGELITSCAISDLSRDFPLPLPQPPRVPPPESDKRSYPSWRVAQDRQLSADMRPPPAPPIELDLLLSDGGIDNRTIRRHLEHHLGKLARCGRTLPSLDLEDGTQPRETYDAHFLIDREGRVVQVIHDDTDPIAACVARTVKTIVFPGRRNELTQVLARVRYGTTDTSAAVLVR